jgi:FtsP/CotA-like multicopper oxidase with cupredoxin domain
MRLSKSTSTAIWRDLDAWTLVPMQRRQGRRASFTVNGRNALDIPVVTNERVRLRLLNARATSCITVRLDRHAATVMAIDGQPAEPFAAREGRITLGPGNRADLFVDTTLAAGQHRAGFVGSDDAAKCRSRVSSTASRRRTQRAQGNPKPLPQILCPSA